jgi:hypothetical protein
MTEQLNDQEKEPLKIARSKLVNLFITLGCTTAPEWNDEQLQQRFDAIPDMFPADTVAGLYQKAFDRLRICKSEGIPVFILDDTAKPIESIIGGHVRRNVVEQAAKNAVAAQNKKIKGRGAPPSSKQQAWKAEQKRRAAARKAERDKGKEERAAAREAAKLERQALRMKTKHNKVRLGSKELATKIMKVLSFVPQGPKTAIEIADYCEMNLLTTEDVLKYLTIFKGVAISNDRYVIADQCTHILTQTLSFLNQD